MTEAITWPVVALCGVLVTAYVVVVALVTRKKNVKFRTKIFGVELSINAELEPDRQNKEMIQ